MPFFNIRHCITSAVVSVDEDLFHSVWNEVQAIHVENNTST
jgi:hypothetical protein